MRQVKAKKRTPAPAHAFRQFDLAVEPTPVSSWPAISVCLIVKNEAGQMRPCLESLGDLASEVIVVDTGSTDRTAEAAGEMGATVHHFAWVNDFSAARNESLRHATKEWIFWLDADDRLAPQTVAQLKAACASGRADAYSCLVQSRHADENLSVTEHIRLFRNGLGIEFSGAVHESVMASVQGLRLDLAMTDILVEHTGYESAEAFAAKIQRNLPIIDAQLRRQPDRPDFLFYRGHMRGSAGDVDGAETDLREYLRRATPARGFDHARFMAFSVLVKIAEKRGQQGEIEALLREALKAFPRHPHFSFALARVQMAGGRTREALDSLLVARATMDRGAVRGARPERATLEQAIAECLVKLGERGGNQAGGTRKKAGAGIVFDATVQANPLARWPSISLCMIVKNEAANLGACLDSVGNLASEVIVVDTGSTDDTAQIARRRGARVYDFPWVNDFSAARNESIRHATKDWVLWMDADDILDPKAVVQIKQAAASGVADAYSCMVCSELTDGSVDVTEHVRIFRNGAGVSFAGAIHETVIASLSANSLRLARTDIEVRHTGYVSGEAMQQRSAERNLPLIEKQLAADPENLDLRFYRGQSLAMAGEIEAAEATMRDFLDRTRPANIFDYRRFWAYILICRAVEARGDLQDLKALVEKALQEFRHHPHFLVMLGRIHLTLKQPQKALESLRMAREAMGGEVRGQRPTETRLNISMAAACLDAGRKDEAISWAERACERNPNEEEIGSLLARLYLETGQPDKAAKLLPRVLTETRKPVAWMVYAELLHRQGEWEKAAGAIEEARSRGLPPNEAEEAFSRLRAARVLAATEGKGQARPAEMKVRGLGHLSRNDHLEAAECFTQAIQADPDDPDNYKYLAVALKKLGREQEALDAWQMAQSR